MLFQLSKEEVLKHATLFDTKQVDRTVIETYLFFAIELISEQYSRTELSLITREVNRLFPMPAMILFKHGKTITLSAINRRLHKCDESKDVLEKVTLIKDIVIENPHRAHIEILFDISFDELRNSHRTKQHICMLRHTSLRFRLQKSCKFADAPVLFCYFSALIEN